MQFRRAFLSVLGLDVQGDIGPVTIYQSKRQGLVAFAKAPPLLPPSRLQIIRRRKFALVGLLWKNQDPAFKIRWRQIAIKARLRISGYNLFMHCLLKQDTGLMITLRHQTGLDFPPVVTPF